MSPTDKRAVKTPLNELVTLTSQSVEVVHSILVAEYDINSEEEVLKKTEEITEAKKIFDNTCKELENRYREYGASHECRTYRRMRLELMRECYSFIIDLNDQQRQLNLNVTYNDNPADHHSLYSVMTAVPNTTPIVNEKEPQSEHVINNHEDQDPNGEEEDYIIRKKTTSTEEEDYVNKHTPGCSALHGSGESGTSSFLIKSELLKKPADPFDGSPGTFHLWSNLLKGRINCVTLTSLEKIQVLSANTIGRPQELIKDYLSNVTVDSANSALEMIWSTLDERYGNKMASSQILIDRLKKLPTISSVDDEEPITRMLDACRNAVCYMEHSPQLEWLNTYEGLQMLTGKFSDSLRSRWRTYGVKSKAASGRNPGLSVFVSFLQVMYKESIDDFFKRRPSSTTKEQRGSNNRPTKVFLTEANTLSNNSGNRAYCYVHKSDSHDLKDCKQFSKFNKLKKLALIKENKLCFRCLGKHFISDCRAAVPMCTICNKNHLTVLHYYDSYDKKHQAGNNYESNFNVRSNNGDGKFNDNANFAKVTRTHIEEIDNNDCCVFSKTFIADVSHKYSSKVIRCVVILDDQSTRCFADSKLMNLLDIKAPAHSYSIETLSGLTTNIEGNLLSGLRIRGVGRNQWHHLPDTLTSDAIPDTRHEMAPPKLIESLKHVSHLANNFNEIDKHAEPMLLIGADTGELMSCVTYGDRVPYVQETPIGFALVGPVSKNTLKKCQLEFPSPKLHVYRTSAIKEGHQSYIGHDIFTPKETCKFPEVNVFERRSDDELKGLSFMEGKFLEKVSSEIHVDNQNRIVVPLPLKEDHIKLPDNKNAVYHRTVATLNKLKVDKEKLEQCCAAIGKNLLMGHIEEISKAEIKPLGRCWWLPVFAVSRPQRKARLVFDAAASYDKTSLNDMLLAGPDLNNDLRAVLLRFRRFPIAISCDIKHMFHNFRVPDQQKDMLRFFWWQDNNPENPIVPYRSNVHLFGAKSSPSIAEFGLKYLIKQELSAGKISETTAQFVDHNFYVDDGLHSCDDTNEAISIMDETKKVLLKYHLQLHKFCSNSRQVESHLLTSDDERAPSTIPLAPSNTQRALGVDWDTDSDDLVITVSVPDRPFTRRGLLSAVNGLFDPIGMAAPVVLGGRIIQRDIMSKCNDENDWDTPLPDDMRESWEHWKNGINGFKITIPRCMLLSSESKVNLYVFADASTHAIGYVIYASSELSEGKRKVSLVVAGSKLAPKAANTMPRLELNAVLEASVAAANVVRNIDMSIKDVKCYTDSKIVLGYLKNCNRSFTRYVARRVDAIRNICPSGVDWNYVSTADNPADYASRPTHPHTLTKSNWFDGPEFLMTNYYNSGDTSEVNYENLPEAVPKMKILRTTAAHSPSPLFNLIDRTSKWAKCVRVAQKVITFAQILRDKVRRRHDEQTVPHEAATYTDAEKLLILAAQQESFPEAFSNSNSLTKLPFDHPLVGFVPFKDEHGLLRAGGRLRNAICTYEVKHPLIISNNHPISERISRACHESCGHQGRVISYAELRNRGILVVRGKKLMNKVIESCCTCKRLRGRPNDQLMSDLPTERVCSSSPFEHVGLDVFGPFYVHDGISTRRSKATKKMYGLIITCLSSRAVHIEPLPMLDTSSFINAMRRFYAVRGSCKTIRSDQGSNFVGAISSSLDFDRIKRDSDARGCEWKMNPPGASHFGGVYERKIGSVRRILEGFLSGHPKIDLSRDEMTTLLQEAASIINSTPLYGVNDDPNEPYPLSPSVILTLKCNPSPESSDNSNESDLISYGRNRWRRVQHIANEFWRSWYRYYLTELTERRKWKYPKRCVAIGDVVLIRSKNVPRNQWLLGLVTDVVKGNDKLVRRVFVRVSPVKGKERVVEKAIHDLVMICRNE